MDRALLIVVLGVALAWVPVALAVRHDAPGFWSALVDGETMAWMAVIGALFMVLWLIVWGLFSA